MFLNLPFIRMHAAALLAGASRLPTMPFSLVHGGTRTARPRHRAREHGVTRINLGQKNLHAGRTSTLRKVMRAAGAK